MAISRVTGQDARGIGTTSTAAATYPGATTSGNLLIASALGVGGTDTLAITGWTKAAHAEAGSNGVAIFYKLADGTEGTVTVTGGNTITRIHIYEYTGNANPIVTDGSNAGSNVASAGATGASVTTTNANDLLFASVAVANSVTSPAATAPFSTRQTDATAIRLFDGDQVVSATGTYAPAFTWTTSTASRNAVVAFKAAASTLTGDASEAVTATRTATAALTKFGDASESVAAGLSATGTVTKLGDAASPVTATLDATAVRTAVGDAALAVTAGRDATATVISGSRVGSTGTLALSISGPTVGSTGTVALSVLGAVVGSTGTLALSVLEQLVGATGDLRVAVYGAPVGSDGSLAVEVDPFAGTGVHRPRSRR